MPSWEQSYSEFAREDVPEKTLCVIALAIAAQVNFRLYIRPTKLNALH